MRHIIIGASGLIGSELLSYLRSRNVNVVGTFSSNPASGLVSFDMTRQSILEVFPDLNPSDTVYLLSAYSNPSWIFEHQQQAVELNLHSSQKLIISVAGCGARIVFMSSVEVFDGLTGNYAENATPAPLNLYGRMKYEIETQLQQIGGNHCIVRTGWNVGWSHKERCVIALTYKSLLVPHAKMAKENTFSIVDVRDTAEGLAKIAKRSEIATCHLANSQPVTRTWLADEIIRNSRFGNLMSYTPTSFSEIKYSEPRARQNHLNVDFSIKQLEMSYRSVTTVIEEKVRLLDSLHSA